MGQGRRIQRHYGKGRIGFLLTGSGSCYKIYGRYFKGNKRMCDNKKRERTIKRITVLFLIFCVLFTMTACNKAEPEEGKTLDLSVCLSSEPRTLDPMMGSSTDGAIMLHHLFEGLLKWTDDGDGGSTLKGGMAASWDVKEDGTEYVFHLREDAKWSDGEPVTAADFVYAWKRLADPKTKSDYNYILDMVVGWREARNGEGKLSKIGMKAVDERTFKVSLTYNCPYFLEICAMPPAFPMRKDMVDKYGEQWAFKADTYVSNGPYSLKSWVHNAYIWTTANEYYYDKENLGPDNIKFVLMDDDEARFTAFEKEELDFLLNPPAGVGEALMKESQGKTIECFGTQALCFHAGKAPFDDPRVREAFSLVIDRGVILKQIGTEGALTAGGYIPPGMKDLLEDGDFRQAGGDYYNLDPEQYKANCDRARQLLSEAGYPEGQGFSPVEYICDRSAVHEAIGKALRTMWGRELGIWVSLSSMERNRFLEARKSGDYEIAYADFFADYDDPAALLELWLSGGGNNDAGYSNTQYDTLVEQARSTADAAVRISALHQAEAILIGSDHVLAPLCFNSPTYVQNAGLKGIYSNPLGLFFFDHAEK